MENFRPERWDDTELNPVMHTKFGAIIAPITLDLVLLDIIGPGGSLEESEVLAAAQTRFPELAEADFSREDVTLSAKRLAARGFASIGPKNRITVVPG